MFEYNNLQIYWLKHAGFKIKTPDGVIYIDPFQITKKQEKADALFISHTHFDHLDLDTIIKIVNTETAVFCSHDAKKQLEDALKVDSIHPLYPNEELIFGHLKINTTSAYNIGKPFHPKENQWLGFIIEVEGVKIYFSGDTDHLEELESIQCDIAMFPVSGTYLMNAEEAAGLANIIKPKVVAIPMHYGTLKDDQGKPIGTEEDAKKFCELCQCPTKILSPIA